MKKVLRGVLESVTFSWFRLAVFFVESARERRRLRLIAADLGFPVLTSEKVSSLRARKPEATTAFILGTGASVNQLSEDKLQKIRAEFSVGVNQWIFHDLIPDVYSYEVDPDTRLLDALNREEIREKLPPVLFLAPTKIGDFANADHVPRFLRERTYFYRRVNLWTREVRNIARDLKNIWFLTSRFGSRGVLVDNGASIARLISLLIEMGFRRIVLVGVDLHNVEYFWFEKPELLRRFGIDSFDTLQRGSRHETLNSTTRPFKIDSFIWSLASAFREDVEILVESSESVLARELPIWHCST